MPSETATLLGKFSLFEALNDEQLEEIAAVAVPRSFEQGEVIFRFGDEGQTCYFQAVAQLHSPTLIAATSLAN